MYADCCEPYVSGKSAAPTAEALMRSRYTAYALGHVAYLKETLAPESRGDFNEKEAKEWSKQSRWLGLTINSASETRVDFTAIYQAQGKTFEHKEKSVFRKDGNRWYFVDGTPEVKEIEPPKMAPVVHEGPKLGRNDPCSCGSGKKFKKCCGVAA
jgi:SEC-C motif domain protein